MTVKQLILGLLIIGMMGCNSSKKKTFVDQTYADIQVVSAMKNVMWKGELESSINLDTISNKKGLYGLGPQTFLTGELLINDGQSYLSKVTSDSTMTVEKTYEVAAPFFVYANVHDWQELTLPSNIKTVQELETLIEEKAKAFKRPFAFKLIGEVANAGIHIQNLPNGTKVSSPDEAHQGQINYTLTNENVELIGFFSTEHKGVFTHHDSFLHIHLISEDESKMGHLDTIEIKKMKLYLPKK